MKFTSATIFAAALAVVSVSAAPQPATTAVPLTPSQKCLNQCPRDDQWANCAAQCVGVPYPSSGDTEDTRNCVAKCPQGDGTAADTQKYADCSNECFKSYFYTSGIPLSPVTTSPDLTATTPSTVTATTTGSSDSSDSGSDDNSSSGGASPTTTGSSGNSDDSSQSGQGSQPTSSDFAPGALRVGAPVVGLAGLLMGIFAL